MIKILKKKYILASQEETDYIFRLQWQEINFKIQASFSRLRLQTKKENSCSRYEWPHGSQDAAAARSTILEGQTQAETSGSTCV